MQGLDECPYHAAGQKMLIPGRSLVILSTMGKCGCELVLTVASPNFTAFNTDQVNQKQILNAYLFLINCSVCVCVHAHMYMHT